MAFASVQGVSAETVDIESLLEQLTLEEKLSLLAGSNIWETVAIPRLNIPSLKTTDGPNGARGATFFDGTTAACFPCCTSLAATFNPQLSHRIGRALGQESLTKGAQVLLGPTVCSHRSPLGGRNFEAFSEDPLLSGVLASEYVRGLQSEGVAATVKHFLGNEQDTRRFSVNEIISERALREIYLKSFEIVVKTADPWCIMTSYPKINGAHVDTSKYFLQDILRGQWGFDGLVMSDWGATTSSVESINAGLDLEMPGKTRWRSPEVINKAISNNEIHPSTVKDRARAVLKLLQRTGKFSRRRGAIEEKALDLPEHRALIREAGAEGIVLLKNQANVLPLKPKKGMKVALLGPLAKYAAAHGGGSASLNCHYKVSPFDAFTNRLGQDVEINYSKGAHIFRVYPDLEAGCKNAEGKPGFTAEYFADEALTGSPFYTQSFPRGSFTTLMDLPTDGKKAVRFTTTYRPPKSGKHYLSYSSMGPSKMWIKDVLVSEQKLPTKDSMSFLLGTQDEHCFQYPFEEGEEYAIRIETQAPAQPNGELYLMDGHISVHFGFVSQEEMEQDVLAEAVELAREADYAICFVGNTIQWETEGEDMSDMNLPANGSQDRLISEVAKVNKSTIVVNTTGVAVTVPWIDQVSAFVQAWYAGQETGNAIFDVLLGEVNPSGKLPISWPKRYEDTAVYGNFGLDSYESREVEYVEGVYVGYRHFDRHYGGEKEVLFPFGYGLSYSSFEIVNAKSSGRLTGADEEVVVDAEVENTSEVLGAETIQAYLAPPLSLNIDRPSKGLIGFSKVSLAPGDKKSISISLREDAAAYWDVSSQKWLVEKGKYRLLLGTSSHPQDLKIDLDIDVDESFSFDP